MSKFEVNEANGRNEEALVRRVGKRGAIACFVAGTRILTMEGQRSVEQLVPGDRILTRDHGLQTLRWIGCRHVSVADVEEFGSIRPIRIAEGALGNGMPIRDMLVSPEHRVMITGETAEKMIGEPEAMIAAKYLVGHDGITVEQVDEVIFYHLMFDDHEVVMTEGTWTVSVLPGLSTQTGLDAKAVDALFEIYPELRVLPTPFKPAPKPVDPVIAKMLEADVGLLVQD